MAHLHDVLDDDPHFRIDADSREIIRTSEKELLLIQDDHNSERCTFDIPKYIDGHDMTLCNAIRVHFINVNAEKPMETSLGLYEVDDLRESTDDPSALVFSWLISSEGTALIGTLSFLVEFMCKNDQDVIEYSWHTGIYTGGVVSKGMNNSEIVIGQHYDVLNRWIALIDQEGDRVRTDALDRIDSAATIAKNNMVSAINEHAENVKKDLVLYGLDVGGMIVHETGNSQEKIMSQASVTEEITRLDGNINEQINDVRADFNSFKTNLDNDIADLAVLTEIPLDDGSAEIEVGKTYIVESNKTSWSWGFGITGTGSIEAGEGTHTFNLTISPTRVDEYASGVNTVKLLRIEPKFTYDENTEYRLNVKFALEINGNRIGEYDVWVNDASGSGGNIISETYTIIGCMRLFKTRDPVQSFIIEANGIESITKTATNVTSTGVVNTYTILLDDGTTTTFDVKDGVGISSFARDYQGDYEDTYKVTFTNGTSKTFKVPNNNTVGIQRSDSGAFIHAENLIPLSHRVNVKVRSKNMIPYPYNYSYGLINGVTFTQNGDGSITANGTVSDGTFANVMVCKSLSLTDGKTYYIGDSPNLLLVYIDAAGVTRYLKNQVFTWKKEYKFIQLYLQYSPGVTVDETVYPMLCESNVPVDYVPYIDLTTVQLTRCCKNLLPPPIIEAGKTKSGVTLTDNGDGTITVNGTATNNLAFVLYQGSMRLNGTYTLSGMTGGSGETYYIQPTFSVGTARGLVDGSRVYEDVDCVMTEIKLVIAAGTSLDNLKILLMLEVGDTASEFEEYHGTDYSIYSDGKPTSFVTPYDPWDYPTMNLLTDKEGVIIDATYNVDQTAEFTDISAKVDGFGTTLDEIKASVNGVLDVNGYARLYTQKSANLFNAESPDIVKDRYIVANGNIGTAAGYCISGKTPVSNGETYCVTKHNSIAAGTLGGVYDANDNFLRAIQGTPNAENNAFVFTISSPNAAYIKINSTPAAINEYMLVKGTEYPAEYIPFWAALTEDFSLNERQKAEVKAAVVANSRIKDYRSANLFDYTSAEEGYYFNVHSGEKMADANYAVAYTKLDGAGNYVTKVDTQHYGTGSGKKLPVFDKDQNYIGSVTGTLDDDTTMKPAATLSFTVDIPGAYYIGITARTTYKYELMLVKGTEYPSAYIPFEEYTYIEGLKAEPSADTQTNVLYGKKISLNGDSICAGAGFKGGYGKIIAERNRMGYQNIAVGGATIVGNTYASDGTTARHWISRTIANMDTDADFAILEGGVNDASRNDPLGTLSEGYNAALDDTTFYGAFESMLKQLVTRFAGKKYGYIAVHKMANKFQVENDEATSYYWAAKKCCEKWGVPFLDLNTDVPPFAYFNASGDAALYALRTTYTHNGDGWHPNEAGYKKYYCDKIEAWLKTL